HFRRFGDSPTARREAAVARVRDAGTDRCARRVPLLGSGGADSRCRAADRRRMGFTMTPRVLDGCKALIVGIANEHSIANGCACAFREVGAEVAITYVNEKTRSYVEPIARRLDAAIFMPLDVAVPGQLDAVFDR